MKYFTATTLIIIALLSFTSVAAHDTPTEIGGFKLGEFITDYPQIEYSDYLKEVVINDWHGFRKGIISYGTCAYPGRIVKIRMKYQNSSKDFYDELLKKLRSRYGKPDEWKGDSFGVLYVWKWRFVDKDNRRVNLILQHNLGDDNENIGNMVKLSFPEIEEEERFCVIDFFEKNKTAEEKETIKQRMKPDWDYMLPR
ncbi:hypothetical protein ACFL0S_13360 [Thermodesulfobacteriota bacterium]